MPKKESDKDSNKKSNNPESTQIKKVIADGGGALSAEEALDIAGIMDGAAAKEKPELQLVESDIPSELQYSPVSELDGKKQAIKSDFDAVAPSIEDTVTMADTYANVTGLPITPPPPENEQQKEKRLTDEELTAQIMSAATKKGRLKLVKNIKDADDRKTKKKKRQKQAFADYDLDGAINDKVAQNESYIRSAQENRRKRRIIAIIILAIFLLFLIAFGISLIINNVTGFTINMTGDNRSGLSLYDNRELVNPSTKLVTTDIPDCDNVTYSNIIDELVATVDDGSVDGLQSKFLVYFAYTFYVQNVGETDLDVDVYLNMKAASKGLDDAVRIVLFQDTIAHGAQGNQRKYTVFAKPQSDPVTDNWFYDTSGKPLMQKLYDPSGNVFPDNMQDNATPFFNKTQPFKHSIVRYKPGVVYKYTVAIYLEGGDPECKDHLIGGALKFSIDFNVTNVHVNSQP